MNIHTIALAQAGSIDFVEVERAFLRHRLVLLRGRTLDLDTFEALTRHLCGTFHVVGTRHALCQASGDGFTTEVFQSGDILIIDNTRYMHGREMTTTPCTRVLVSRFGGRSSLSPESPMAAPSRIGDPERKALMWR